MAEAPYQFHAGQERMEYRDLEVWRKCHHLTLALYKVTESEPRAGYHELLSQLRQAVTAIPGSIAEGCGKGRKGLAGSLREAMGSASELDYLLLLARDLDILSGSAYEQFTRDLAEVRRMVNALLQGLEMEW